MCHWNSLHTIQGFMFVLEPEHGLGHFDSTVSQYELVPPCILEFPLNPTHLTPWSSFQMSCGHDSESSEFCKFSSIWLLIDLLLRSLFLILVPLLTSVYIARQPLGNSRFFDDGRPVCPSLLAIYMRLPRPSFPQTYLVFYTHAFAQLVQMRCRNDLSLQLRRIFFSLKMFQTVLDSCFISVRPQTTDYAYSFAAQYISHYPIITPHRLLPPSL